MIKRSTSRVLASAALLAAIGFAGFSMRSTNAIAAEAQPSGGAAGTSTKSGAALQSHDLSLEQAQVVLAAAVKKAQELHINQDVAVVDAGGNLKAFYRMDNAWLGSIDISIKKAKTARYFDMPTGAIGKLSQPGGPLYQIEVSNGGLITFPGGVPIKAADDTIIGAVGVSGSTVENDEECAKAGAAAIR